MFEGISLSHARRLGKTEKLERSESRDLGLRVLIGKRQAMVSSSDRSPKMLDELVERTIAMARAVPEDPFIGLADPGEVAQDWPALDMLDPDEPDAETLIERARAAEDAALAVEGVTNSEGAEAGWGRSRIALVASNGFAGGYAGSHPRGQRRGDRRLRREDGARLRFRERGLCRRSARPGRDRPQCRRAHRQAARRAQDADRSRSGRVRPARRAQPDLASAGSDFRPLDRARHQLSEGPARTAHLSRGDHDHRGPAPNARAALEAVRRRGPAEPAPGADRQRRADDMAARSALGPAARTDKHRPRGARHGVTPLARGYERLDRARRGELRPS